MTAVSRRSERGLSAVHADARAGVRAFRLTIERARAAADEGDRYGVRLEESYANGERTLTSAVAHATPLQTARILDAVVTAVRTSGHQAGVLTAARKTPIPLDEAAGVRLALTLLAAQPITKPTRIRHIVAGVASMSTEETYYWYAKAVGPGADRVRRALRLFLAEE
ncbi:DUF7680 family protein [Kribbella sp. NPDC002412]